MSKLAFNKRITETWIYPIICEQTDQIEDSNAWISFLESECEEQLPFRIFIQIPVCSEICDFCPYYKEPLCSIPKEKMDHFIDSIIKELQFYSRQKYFKNRKLSTICVGGGDPSSVNMLALGSILEFIRSSFDMSEFKAISMEGTVKNFLKPNVLDLLNEYHVDRISFGVQTFNQKLREILHISVSKEEIYQLVETIKKTNIGDYSLDMMYNLPEQTMDILKSDLSEATGLEPKYIDIHGMDIYPNTEFFQRIYNGEFVIGPSKERERLMYQGVMDFFEDTKYNQVSSNLYSLNDRPFIGYERFLRGYPMLGIGPSARSYINCRSFKNVNQIDRYIDMLQNNRLPIEYGNVVSKEVDLHRKIVFFPSVTWIAKQDIPNDEKIYESIQDLIDSGYAEWKADILKLTKKGKIYAGNISRLFYSKDQLKRDFRNMMNMIDL